MIITLELTPEQEARYASAEAQGIDVSKLMLNTLNNFPPAASGSKKTNAPKILKGRGMFAHSTRSVDDFMLEKQEEIDREDQQFLRLCNGNG